MLNSEQILLLILLLIPLSLLIIAAIISYRHSPLFVIKNYLKADTPEKRATYVLYPDEVLPYMKKKYGDKTNNILCGMSEPTLFGPNDIYQRVVVYKNYGDGEYTGVYYLKKVGDSYKIDWALSQYAMGYRGYGIKRMQLLPDSSSHYLFDVVRASDFYNYGFSSHKNDMFSFDIGTNRTSCLNGYCYKNDSRVAEIYNYIVEKGPCLISCEARYTSLSENNNRFAEIENIKIIRCCDYVLKDIYSSGEYIIENKDLLSVL